MKDYSRVGKLKFVAKRIHVPPYPFLLEVKCFMCEQLVGMLPNQVMAVFTIGNENVGYCCDGCLSDDELARLAEIREEMQP